MTSFPGNSHTVPPLSGFAAPGRVYRSRFSRLSTALKMFFILGLALFPLGLVAALASLDAARDGRQERELLARSQAVDSARGLRSLLERDILVLGTAAAGASLPGIAVQACELLARTARLNPDLALGGYSLHGADGGRLCASPSFVAATPDRPLAPGETRIWIDRDAGLLRYGVRDRGGYAIAALDVPTLRNAATGPSPREGRMALHLTDGRSRLELAGASRSALEGEVVARAKLNASAVDAVASVATTPISAVEVVTILVPLVMWLAAALLGWLIVDRLLLRPIVTMQKAVLAYRPGGKAMVIPEPVTPATEIRDLGEAFARVTRTVAAHEAELEAAIARQARLVREVHHRVKNNLQVVASLLNLHARGARSVDAADAYASILRRVDALAVVHRNHFAELEDGRGIALRTLLSELTGNLRGTAPDAAAGMAITLDLDAAHVNQDVAVSIAFFVTEVVEHAMLCTPADPVAVSLRRSDMPAIARLRIASTSLKAGVDCTNVDVRQFERITTGLSRQLRAVLERDTDAGAFAIDIAVQAAAD